MCVSPQPRAIFRHWNLKKCSETVSLLAFWLGNLLLATTACNLWTSELQKVVRTCAVLCIFTWKCASSHSGMQFSTSDLQKVVRTCAVLYISTWKCASRHSKRATFRHRNFKKRAEPEVFCAFSLENVFSPQRPAIFGLPFDHMGRRPTFRLTRHTNHWKNTAFRDFSNIWRRWIFFLTFALLHLLSLDFTSSHLCFGLYSISFAFHLLFNSPYCRKFTI